MPAGCEFPDGGRALYPGKALKQHPSVEGWRMPFSAGQSQRCIIFAKESVMSRAPILASVALLSIGLATGASAQEADWTGAPQVTVALTSFDYTPSTIRLRAGQPVVLRLVNDSSGGHNFSAPDFFAASAIRPQEQGLIYKGAIEVPKRQSREIALVPRAGTYKLRCTHTMHTMFGMKGEIVVE
jgi:plastocyanin